MTIGKRFPGAQAYLPVALLASFSVAVALLILIPTAALAGDESYSSVIKHLKKNYHAKQQGFFGAMMLARFAVKVIRPAGVKNFKLTLLKDLDYSEAPSPIRGEFHSFIRSKIDPRWTPLVQYSSPRDRQWSYVYVTREKEHVKLLVVTLAKRDAVVLQTKFSPEKLIEFMNNPQIMGISLGDNRSSDNHARADSDDDDESRSERPKPVSSKPPE
jgi:hypothetical protein